MNHSRSILNHGIISSKLLLVFLFFAILQYATAQTPPPPPPPPADPFAPIGPGFNPSMAIIMVVLISAFFFMGFFSVYIRQCADRRFGRSYQPSLALAGPPRRSRRVARGLDAAVIASFPTFSYSAVKGLRIGKDSLECAVCLNEFEDDETLRLIPKCSHVFHPDCIDAWLESHTTCPVCRANLVPKPGEVLSCAAVQVFEPDTNPVQPEPPRPDADEVSICVAVAAADNNNDHQHGDVVQSPDLNLINTSERANQNRPPRSRSTGWRFSGLFPRSRSTGNSLVQLGENCDRFTLRLPEEVRSQLMNSTLNRSKSCMAFPRARSLRRGYRSRSVGNWRGRNYFYYERFDQDGRSDQLGFTLTPPFISKTSSVRSQKVVGDDEVVATPSRSLFRSIKSSFDRLSHGGDNNAGEQSSDRLRPDSQV